MCSRTEGQAKTVKKEYETLSMARDCTGMLTKTGSMFPCFLSAPALAPRISISSHMALNDPVSNVQLHI